METSVHEVRRGKCWEVVLREETLFANQTGCHIDQMQTPVWYFVLQILFPAAIGLGVVLVAFGQFRIARQRVVLDLFDRRFRIFQRTTEVSRQVLGAGKATDDQAREILLLSKEAQFLFGPEIFASLETLFSAMWDIQSIVGELNDERIGPERSHQISKLRDALNRVEKIQKDLPRMLRPYMRMDTKVP